MDKLLVIILPVLLAVGSPRANQSSMEFRQEVQPVEVPVVDYQTCITDSVIATALSYLGTSYSYGGSSTNGIDCSGLIGKAFEAAGYALPRSSSSISQMGIEVALDSVQRGDLIFFTGRNSASTSVGHVALVAANDSLGIELVHATQRGVVHDVLSEQEYYQDRILFAKRIDLIAY